MLNANVPDPAATRLRTEPVIWLTTVGSAGQPQSSPVWFFWNGDEFLIFGSKDGQKTRNIQANPRVGLNLDGDGSGGGIVIFEGEARIDAEGAPADLAAGFQAKYAERIASYGWTLEALARDYPHAIRVTPARLRVW